MANFEGFSKKGMELGDNPEGIKEEPFYSESNEEISVLKNYCQNLITQLLFIDPINSEESNIINYLLTILKNMVSTNDYDFHLSSEYMQMYMKIKHLNSPNQKFLFNTLEFVRSGVYAKIDFAKEEFASWKL